MFHAGGALQMPALPFDVRQFDSWFSLHTYSHNVALIDLATFAATARVGPSAHTGCNTSPASS